MTLFLSIKQRAFMGLPASARNVVSPKRFQSKTSSVRSANFLYRGFVSPKINLCLSVRKKKHFASPKIKICRQSETSSVRKVISLNLKITSSVLIKKERCQSESENHVVNPNLKSK